MGNKNEHLGGALILFLVFYLVLNWLRLEQYIFYAITLFIGAIIPDLIEPANHWTHRKFFHSKRTLKFLSTWGIGVSFFLGLIFHDFLYLFFGVVGYALHLVQDSTTPAGLPE